MIRQRWGRFKPPPGAVVNYGHPFGQNLKEGWLFNEGSGSRIHALKHPRLSFTMTQWTAFVPYMDWNTGFPTGPAFDILSGSNGSYHIFGTTDGGQIIENSDSFCISVIFAATGGSGYLVGRGNDRVTGWGLQVTGAVGSAPTCTVITTVPSTAGYTATGTTTIVSGKWYHAVGVWRPGVQVEIWLKELPGGTAKREGVTTTTSTVLRQSTGYGFNFNLGAGGSDVPQTTGRYGHVLVTSALPDAVILEHFERPYDFLMSPVRPRLNSVAAPGGATITPSLMLQGVGA